MTVFDNFSSGREWHFEEHRARGDERLQVLRGNVNDLDVLTDAMSDHDVVDSPGLES